MKFMITKKSSGPVTNCSQLKRDPIAARKLVLSMASRKYLRTLPAILWVILYSRKQGFLEVNGNGLRLRLIHHQGAVLLAKVSKNGHEDGSSYDQYEREEDGSYHW